MATKEKRHVDHSGYFASPILLLVFALQGFLPAAALSASEPLIEVPAKSR